jgi:hypothetical protein
MNYKQRRKFKPTTLEFTRDHYLEQGCQSETSKAAQKERAGGSIHNIEWKE